MPKVFQKSLGVLLTYELTCVADTTPKHLPCQSHKYHLESEEVFVHTLYMRINLVIV